MVPHHVWISMATTNVDPHPAVQEIAPVRVTSEQWRSGIAAWLGWTFDGLDMHLYTLVAAPFVAQLQAGKPFMYSATASRSAVT